MTKKQLNILHVVTNLGDGGLEKIVYLITKKIKDEDIQHFVAILIESKNEFLNIDFLRNGAKLQNFNFENRLNNIFSPFHNFKESLKLARFIKKNKINIIHSHDFFPAFSARVASVLSFLIFFHKVDKIVITLHNNFIWLKSYHHFINRCMSLITYRIVCVSRSVLDYSQSNDKIKRDKYQIIFNGVETENYFPDYKNNLYYRNYYGIPESSIVIGNVGVLSVRKGQKFLIEAFNILLKKYDNIILMIFGSERNHEREIATEIYDLINKYDIKSKVLIAEPTKELDKIYNVFDVFVMSSITEGLSLSAIEAMLTKRICLFSDIPSFKELVNPGENGFLFKSEDIRDLSNKLSVIIENIESYEQVKENARNFAIQNFNADRMCNDYRMLYLN